MAQNIIMNISNHDKNQIQLIDEQVKILQEKSASDEAIIEALIEFVPEAMCFFEILDSQELQNYITQYEGFAFFLSKIKKILIS